METNIAVFRGKEIRKTIHKNEWWFSIVDVCAVLTGSADAGAYWRKLKQRLREEGSEVVTFCHGLKLTAPDGKLRETDCANTEGIFRIIHHPFLQGQTVQTLAGKGWLRAGAGNRRPGAGHERRGDEGVNKRALTTEEICINLSHENNSCIKIPLPLIPVDGSTQADSISPGLIRKKPPRQDR